MDETLLQILERLEPGGIGGVNDISDIINNQFLFFTDKRDFEIQRSRILDFLNYITEDVEFFRPILEQVSEFDENNMPTRWIEFEMRVTLTNNGLKHLESHRLLLSTIALNDSTIENNRIVSDNTRSQSNIFIFQSVVFAFGALFACLSFVISCNTYFRDDKIKPLQSQLSSLKKDSILLEKKLSQLKATPKQVQIKHDTIYVK